MSVQITAVPVWEMEQQIQTTRLRIQIDLSGVQAMLDSYNMLVETKVSVQAINPVTKGEETLSYPCTNVVHEPGQKTLEFTIPVAGIIEDQEKVRVTSKGYWINK